MPAAKQLKEDLLGLARAATNILERFKELVMEDFDKSDDEKLLESRAEEYL